MSYRDEDAKVRDIDIRGELIPVYINRDGLFFTNEPLAVRHCKTWEELRQKLLNLTKKAATKLSIEITAERGGKLVDGVVRGRHGGNSNILIQWDGNKTAEQESGYYHDEYYLRLNSAEKAEWKRLYDARAAAAEAFRKWTEPRQIRLSEVVDKALNAAAAEEAAPIG